MKTKSASTCAIVSLSCLAFFLSCVSPDKPADLRKAAKDKDLTISLNGTVTVNSLDFQAKNASKTEHKIKVPAGAVLSSKDESLQPLIVFADTEIALGPEEEKTVSVPVFGLNFRKSIAATDDRYETASYGSQKDPSIKKILAYLSSDSGKADYPATDSDKMNTVQQAVWLVTDKLGYEENIGFVIDSLILTSIIQQNPMAISALLDDASTITDEASMQEALYSLAMDKPKLREKLKSSFTDQYEAAVKQLKTSIDAEAGPSYRKSVNDFIAKAGLKITY
jgi:hypothetical protein